MPRGCSSRRWHTRCAKCTVGRVTDSAKIGRRFGRLARVDWAQAITVLIVLVITGITAAVSYEHEYQLARRNGQDAWVSALLPVTVDGMVLVASVVLLWASSRGVRRPFRPLAVLLAGIGATIGANLGSGVTAAWLRPAVAASSGVALVLSGDVLMWFIGRRRKLIKGEQDQPGFRHRCPPPPLTLAEWVPLARAELKRLGLPAGDVALAAAMCTKRYQIEKASAPSPIDAAPAAGPPAVPPVVTPPGQPEDAPAAGLPRPASSAAGQTPPRAPATANGQVRGG
jgi:hypothetical protein